MGDGGNDAAFLYFGIVEGDAFDVPFVEVEEVLSDPIDELGGDFRIVVKLDGINFALSRFPNVVETLVGFGKFLADYERGEGRLSLLYGKPLPGSACFP